MPHDDEVLVPLGDYPIIDVRTLDIGATRVVAGHQSIGEKIVARRTVRGRIEVLILLTVGSTVRELRDYRGYVWLRRARPEPPTPSTGWDG